MAALEPHRFEPERVFNPEDENSEGEEKNELERRQSTFWCTCGECPVMATDKECTCCREQPVLEDKIKGILNHVSCFL